VEKSDRRILVGIATYNEKDTLPDLLQGIQQHLPSADILITDDNSPDGTGELADQYAARDSRIHVIHRPGKMGLGSAILGGMRYAIEKDYDLFVSMDADLSHQPKYLPALVEGAEKYDVMIGSRYVPGGGTVNWPLSRLLMSRGVNTLVRVLMRLPAKDNSGGYRCYRIEALRKARLDEILSLGYSFQEEVLHKCVLARSKVGETPIVFEDRAVGQSKANVKEMIRSLGVLIYLGLGTMFGDVRERYQRHTRTHPS